MKKPPLLKSFGFAFQGIGSSLKERNMRIHIVMAVIAVILGIFLELSAVEWGVLVLTIGAVLSLETLNTALENLVDLVSPEYHQLAKVAKDAAAGAVLIMAIASVIIGCFLFIPHIRDLIF